jgi:CelD/BcsL family acetyltransferase involved in cellulose biosynthesis
MTTAPICILATTLAELERHAAAWNALAERCPQQLPMASHAWVASYLEHCLPEGSRRHAAIAYRGDRLVAVLVVRDALTSALGQPLAYLQTPRDDHTQIGDLLCEPHDRDAARAVLRAVSAARPECAFVEVARFPENSPLLDWTRSGALHALRTWKSVSYGAYLPVPADFAAYRQGLSKNFRSNLNKATNKAAKLRDVAWRFEHGASASPDDLVPFADIEASGWKGQQGSAIRNSPVLMAFYRSLVARLRAAGWLEWEFFVGDGRLLAGNLSVRIAQSLIIWKLGYDDEYSRCSPGSLLLEELLKREVACGELREINLTTNLPWYDNWQMRKRTYYTARFYFGWRGVVAWAPDALRAVARELRDRVAAALARMRARRATPPDVQAPPER